MKRNHLIKNISSGLFIILALLFPIAAAAGQQEVQSKQEQQLEKSSLNDQEIIKPEIAEKIGYNELLSSGNMLENQFEVYENPIIVEYYFPGFKAKFGGMDWKSLRLVFEEYQNKWKLTGIIHNQWTI